jgi:glucokinase
MPLAAAADVGGTKVFAALVDDAGSIHGDVVEIPTDRSAGTTSAIAALRQLLETTPEQVHAVGVAAAGFVEHPQGRIAFAPNLTYDRPDLRDAVHEALSLPTVVENDANAAAWGETRFGAGRGMAEVLMLTVGTGIGGGIVTSGRLHRGARGFAAEVGHISLVEGGPVCACGQRGHLEALASGTAIGRMAREELERGETSLVTELAGRNDVTGALVTKAALDGDLLATSVLERAGRWLGRGLANLVNVLDPGLIIIGGGAAAAGALLLEPAADELAIRLEGRREPPPMTQARLGNRAGAIGAASLALELTA